MPPVHDPAFEQRLDELRREAHAAGTVNGKGVDVAGGPIPVAPPRHPNRKLGASENSAGKPGYYGMPVIKPPVWTWEIPLYFFIGGASGMAAVIAMATLVLGHLEITRPAMWIAAAGGILTPVLLIMDLGRPMLFLNMLRIFKPQSAMSMGVYILTPFGMCSIPGAMAMELYARHLLPEGILTTLLHLIVIALVIISGLSGMLLATYTGVLLGATAIPAWHTHRSLLPLHFGIAGLGSAAGILELLNYRPPPLNAISWAAISVETILWLTLFRRHGLADRAVHEGTSGKLLKTAEILTGLLPLALRTFGLIPFAAGSFILGSLLSRFGWVMAGRASAKDPMAVFDSQR